MTRIFASVFLMLISFNALAQEDQPMPGVKVRKAKDVDYDKNGLETFHGETVTKFNKEGRVIEEYRRDLDKSKLFWLHTYKYNERGDQIEFAIYTSDGELESKRITEYKYSLNGQKEEESCFDMWHRLEYHTLFKYDDRGRILKELHYSGANLWSVTSFEYNENGLCKSKIRKLYYWSNTQFRSEYHYSEKGKLVKIDEYKSSSNQNERLDTTSEYDENGRLKIWKIFNDDKTLAQTIEYDYDELGYKKEQRIYYSLDEFDNVWRLRSKTTYEYEK